jgi:hypothetical protein
MSHLIKCNTDEQKNLKRYGNGEKRRLITHTAPRLGLVEDDEDAAARLSAEQHTPQGTLDDTLGL